MFNLKECDNADKDKKDEGGLAKELLKARTIIISEEVSEELAQKVYAQILVMNNQDKKHPIYVYINSPGGDADSGFGIYDMLRFVEAPVITVVTGLCASAAVIIFLAADKGKHFSTPNSRFLLHQPSTGTQGTASDLEITAKEITKTRERYNQIVADVTGKSIEDINRDADRDFWMSPEEAADYGLVAKVIANRTDIK